MYKKEHENYLALNDLAEPNGIVIFGGTEDKEIPLCELKQAFDLKSSIYNRSFSELSIDTAEEIYDTCVAPLCPETLLLHIGDANLASFNASDFDQKYRGLIKHIKTLNSKCNIAIISLRNYDNDVMVAELNRHLKYIADSEHCEFGDISAKRIWNPKQTKEVTSFLYSTGFVRPLKMKRPIYDLVKILFCYEI